MKHTSQIQLSLALLLSISLTLLSCLKEEPPRRELIVQIIEELRASDKPENSAVYTNLSYMYDTTGYVRLWDNQTVAAALEQLDASKIHGLNPENYKYSELESIVKQQNSGVKLSTEQILKTDVLTSYAMLLYGKHMIQGKTEPTTYYPTWNYSRRTFNQRTAEFLLESINDGDLEAYVNHITPDNWYYELLTDWVKEYYDGSLSKSPELSFPNLPLEKGQEGEAVSELKYRLSQYDSYDGGQPTDEFDDQLENAVKEFQRSMGIEGDGVVGQGTLDALNMSLEQKLDMVRVNLERGRWLLHDLPARLLLVNIAGYELYIFERQNIVHRTPVIVGKPHHETPLFHSKLEYVELNCTWTVPRSITVNELLPKIKSDPNYLSSRHFEVLQGEEVIDPSTVNFSDYTADDFPFVLRQKPGSWNSLGTMKFIFPNKYSIYLHDTPARNLFEKEGTRAFSHGCVRVKNPEDLAVEVLSGQGVSKSQIDEILESQETKRIHLEEPLPVLLTYWTVFPDFDGDGPMHWVRDIYGRDAKILSGLDM